jgi:ribosomal protein S18 acetylase RimI-like enzyme
MIDLGPADAATDWAEVLDLLHRAFSVMEGRIDPPSSLHDMTESTLAEKAAQGLCLLAETGGVVIGCAFCAVGDDDDALHISKLAVDPDHQGGGVGRALIDLAEANAKAAGLDALQLQTRVELTENHIAFARLGFQKIGETAHPGYDRPTSVTLRRPV